MNSPLPSTKPTTRRKLACGVVSYVTTRVQQGAISPGDKLPTELEIMGLMGVSRTVVREAISRLQAAGVVETRHGIGTFVMAPPPMLVLDPPTVGTVLDLLAILELRISIETEAASLACSRRTPEQLIELRSALDTFSAAVHGGGATVPSDSDFHLLIARCSGNRYFYDILQHLGTNSIPRARVDSARLADDDPARYMQRILDEHENIYQAIARADSETARAAMRHHLSNSRERLRRVLPPPCP
jgi:GntR family transcriptional repressor for pyruvate dehydrogenase complex